MNILGAFLSDYHHNQDAQAMVRHCITQYCHNQRLDVKAFANDDANIPKMAQLVHEELNWGLRKIIKQDEVQTFVKDHIVAIRKTLYEQA